VTKLVYILSYKSVYLNVNKIDRLNTVYVTNGFDATESSKWSMFLHPVKLTA